MIQNSIYEDSSFESLNDRDVNSQINQKIFSNKQTPTRKLSKLCFQNTSNTSAKSNKTFLDSNNFTFKNCFDSQGQMNIIQGSQQQSFLSKRISYQEQNNRASYQDNRSLCSRKHSEQKDLSNIDFDDNYNEECKVFEKQTDLKKNINKNQIPLKLNNKSEDFTLNINIRAQSSRQYLKNNLNSQNTNVFNFQKQEDKFEQISMKQGSQKQSQQYQVIRQQEKTNRDLYQDTLSQCTRNNSEQRDQSYIDNNYNEQGIQSNTIHLRKKQSEHKFPLQLNKRSENSIPNFKIRPQSSQYKSYNNLSSQNTNIFTYKKQDEKFEQINKKVRQCCSSKGIRQEEQNIREFSSDNLSQCSRKNLYQKDLSCIDHGDDQNEESIIYQNPHQLEKNIRESKQMNKKNQDLTHKQKRSISSKQIELQKELDQINETIKDNDSHQQFKSSQQIFYSIKRTQNQKVFNFQNFQEIQHNDSIFNKQQPEEMQKLKQRQLDEKKQQKIKCQNINFKENTNTINTQQNTPLTKKKQNNKENLQTLNKNNFVQKFFGKFPNQQEEEKVISNPNIQNMESLNSDNETEIKSLIQNVLPKGKNQSSIKKIQKKSGKIQNMYKRILNSKIEKEFVNLFTQIVELIQFAEKEEEEYLTAFSQIIQLIDERENKRNLNKESMLELSEKNYQLELELKQKDIQIQEMEQDIKEFNQYKNQKIKLNQFLSKLMYSMSKSDIDIKLCQFRQIMELTQSAAEKEDYLTIFSAIVQLVDERDKKINSDQEIIFQLSKKNDELGLELKQKEKQIQELKDQDKKQLKQYEDKMKELEEKISEQQKQFQELEQQNIQLHIEMELQQDQQNQNQKQIIQDLIDDVSQSKIKGERSNQQVQDQLQSLNPGLEIQENLIQFTKTLQNLAQSQPSIQQQSDLKIQNDILVQDYLKNEQNVQQQQQQKQQQQQQQQNNINQNPSSNYQDIMKCLLALQSMYKQEGITTFITDEPIQKFENDNNHQAQQSLIQTGMHNKASFFSVQINEETNLYQKLKKTSNKQQLKDFIQDFKKDIGKMVDSQNPFKDVVVLNFSFDTIPKIDFQINSEIFTQAELKQKITFSDIGVSLSVKNLLEYAKLSVNMFSPDYNVEWTESDSGKYEYRGQIKFINESKPKVQKYYFPTDYKGYALNIDKYGENKDWLSKNADDKTWIVLFHGTNENSIEGITKDNLAPGKNNKYGGVRCRITDTIIKDGPNANVYLTNDIKTAEWYAKITTIHGGKKYKIVFQCRVNPKGVKSPVSQHKYFTVENNENIRPYRILLKEIKQ